MSGLGKKHRQATEAIMSKGPYSWEEALQAVVEHASAKFDESVGIDIVLGIDPSKGEQVVRGSVLLPHGTGKKVRVAAFVKGEHADAATAAGADVCGADELVEKIASGWLDFDVSVATPDMMGLVGKVAKVLGPRGLLPNKKVGTVTFDIGSIISDLKGGRVSFRNDKGGGLHLSFGKVSFGAAKLLENLSALMSVVRASKPASSKGKFVKKIVISSSMGVGIPLASDESAVKKTRGS